MSTLTTRLSLVKMDPTEVADFNISNTNLDTIDLFQTFERRTSFPSSPVIGKSVMRSDRLDTCYVWNGSVWFEIERYRSASHSSHGSTITTTSTSFTPGSTVLDLLVRAPASGRLWLSVSGELDIVSPSFCALSFELYEGSDATGTLKTGADDRRALIQQEVGNIQATFRDQVSGLTPYAQHYMRAMIRSSSGVTATAYRRRIMAEY